MVDKQRLIEELRELKRQIRNDPEVRAHYDLNGDGEIDGQEWDLTRKAVISYLESEEARNKEESVPKSAAVAGATAAVADQVFNRIKKSATHTDYAPAGTLLAEPAIIVSQKVEDLEVITDFEGRNKYRFLTEDGRELAKAQEGDTGTLGMFSRSFLGNRRPFTMWITDHKTNETVILKRHFDLIFSKIDVSDEDEPIGTVQQRFGFFNKKYDLLTFFGDRNLSVVGPLFKPWTFDIFSGDEQVGSIKKKWSGFLKEAFTKADNFLVSFDDPQLTAGERKLILAAAIAIDMDCFERKN